MPAAGLVPARSCAASAFAERRCCGVRAVPVMPVPAMRPSRAGAARERRASASAARAAHERRRIGQTAFMEGLYNRLITVRRAKTRWSSNTHISKPLREVHDISASPATRGLFSRVWSDPARSNTWADPNVQPTKIAGWGGIADGSEDAHGSEAEVVPNSARKRAPEAHAGSAILSSGSGSGTGFDVGCRAPVWPSPAGPARDLEHELQRHKTGDP